MAKKNKRQFGKKEEPVEKKPRMRIAAKRDWPLVIPVIIIVALTAVALHGYLTREEPDPTDDAGPRGESAATLAAPDADADDGASAATGSAETKERP